MAFPRNNIFTLGLGAMPEASSAVEIDPTNLSTIVASGYAITTVSSGTIATTVVGSRPAFILNNPSSGATNVVNWMVGSDCIIPVAGKTIAMKGSFRMATTTQEFAMGFSSTSTNFIGSSATDYIAVQKASGVTQFSLISRKASGTAATTTLSPVIAANTWYDYSMIITMDSTTAGLGTVQVFMGSGGTPGTLLPLVYNAPVTSIPDTVNLRPFFCWRGGSSASVNGYLGKFGWISQM
jgi:hypothetical protein